MALPTYITAVRLSKGGTDHTHIVGCHVLNREPQTGYSEAKKVSWVIARIEAGDRFITRDYLGNVASVTVVRPNFGDPYIRTKADGKFTDNLLRLSRYE